jgi:hypothetical protein
MYGPMFLQSSGMGFIAGAEDIGDALNPRSFENERRSRKAPRDDDFEGGEDGTRDEGEGEEMTDEETAAFVKGVAWVILLALAGATWLVAGWRVVACLVGLVAACAGGGRIGVWRYRQRSRQAEERRVAVARRVHEETLRRLAEEEAWHEAQRKAGANG